MSEGYNFKQLREQILARSSAEEWEVAKKEWGLVEVYEADAPETCLCGHFPIVEICRIRNRITKQVTEVGNVCVRRFLGLRSDLIFAALKRIRKNNLKSLNADSAVFFHDRGVLSDWEYQFTQDTMNKRSLSRKQAEQRKRINQKVLDALARRGFQGPD